MVRAYCARFTHPDVVESWAVHAASLATSITGQLAVPGEVEAGGGMGM